MALLDSAQPRTRRTRRKKKLARSQRTLDAPLSANHPDQILSFRDWCRLNRISESTGRRILAGGSGPVVTQFGERRFGITVANNAQWQASRARGCSTGLALRQLTGAAAPSRRRGRQSGSRG
jgi:hypothetical protein